MMLIVLEHVIKQRSLSYLRQSLQLLSQLSCMRRQHDRGHGHARARVYERAHGHVHVQSDCHFHHE